MPNESAAALFHYSPSKPLAVLCLLTFLIFSVIFTVRIHRTKSASFLFIIPVVAFGEFIAFIYRIMSVDNPSLSRFISMTLFSMLVPMALPLVNNMAVAQVIKHSRIPSTRFFLNPSFVSWFFFGSDIVHFWIQRLGELNTNTAPNSFGIALFIASVSIQSMTLAAFIFTTIYVHQSGDYAYQIKRAPNAKSRIMLCVYITSFFQYIRYVYRASEYVSGFDAAMNSHEWVFYVFETLMVLACLITHSVLFIGNYLPTRDDSVDSKDDIDYVRVSDLGDEDLDNMITESKKHVAVFNNVQKVNYSISVDP